MSSVVVMVLVICPLVISAVRPSKDLWDLECLPTVGIVGQTTVISCSIRSITDIEVVAVTLTKATQEKPVLEILPNGEKSGDQRFSLENLKLGPSLQISNTVFSDEGKYLYHVFTDTGDKKIQISLSITAKYKNPNTSTWPTAVTEGGPVNLYCNATDGYPAGFIHWFDRSGTNWTVNSELTKFSMDTNGLKSVALSSKLTFKSIDLSLAPFRCIVLNSKYAQDGESTLRITSAMRDPNEESSPSNTTNIVAGVMVIGSLIVGLLFALLCFRKRNVKHYETGKTDDDLETGNTMSSSLKLPLSEDEIETKY